jgi:hypothetical protein
LHLADKVQVAVFESISDLRKLLPHVEIRDMGNPDVEQKIRVRGWSFGGQYCHLTGSAGMCLTPDEVFSAPEKDSGEI